MALRDIRDYYFTMMAQYLELQQDLADFEQAFKDGYITEDKLEEVKTDVARVKENYDRLTYIVYLAELPNRKEKKEKALKGNTLIEEYFKKIGASSDVVFDENKSTIAKIKAELKALTDK